jgi:hypothetical protein
LFFFLYSVNSIKLEYEHAAASRAALDTFAAHNRHLGARHVEEGQRRLEADLAAQLSRYRAVNNDKKLAARLKATIDQLRQGELYCIKFKLYFVA